MALSKVHAPGSTNDQVAVNFFRLSMRWLPGDQGPPNTTNTGHFGARDARGI